MNKFELNPCPNPECKSEDIEFFNGPVFWPNHRCSSCHLSSSRVCSDDKSIDIVEEESARLWNNLPREPEWISVENRMPQENTIVIVSGGIALFKNGGWYTGMESPAFDRMILWKVTHWMPLSKPPKDKP